MWVILTLPRSHQLLEAFTDSWGGWARWLPLQPLPPPPSLPQCSFSVLFTPLQWSDTSSRQWAPLAQAVCYFFFYPQCLPPWWSECSRTVHWRNGLLPGDCSTTFSSPIINWSGLYQAFVVLIVSFNCSCWFLSRLASWCPSCHILGSCSRGFSLTCLGGRAKSEQGQM